MNYLVKVLKANIFVYALFFAFLIPVSAFSDHTFTIGNLVWNDLNQDGIQDSGEPGIPNVTVELYKDGILPAESVASTTSGGNYYFTIFETGNYYIKYVLPSGYAFSPKDQGTDDAKDSDVDPTTGKTETLYINVELLSSNGFDDSWDAGMYIPPLPASVGDFVWNDTNKNGIQDVGEPGIGNVLLKLYDQSGTEIRSTSTNSSGWYEFSGLVAGNYTVEIDNSNFLPGAILDGWNASPEDAGTNDALDSDGGEESVTLASGIANLSVDFGFYLQSDCQEPIYNSASIDGNDTEWNLSTDFFANMYRAGNPNKDILSKLYVRYDCTTEILYVLVKAENPGYPVDANASLDDHFVKLGTTKLVDAFSYPPNEIQPEFAWIGLGSGAATGWEASMHLASGEYDNFNVHSQIVGDETSAVAYREVELCLYCAPPEDCCDQGDKPQILIMEYTGEDCSATNTTQDSDKVGCDGDPNYDPNVYIISNDNDDPNSGNIWFSGNVALNSTYYIDAANAGATKLENNTVIHIFDSQGGTLLQTVNFHTSCSQPLSEHSDQWGANKLIGIIFENGIDCGDIPDAASLGDFVWNDINQNGIQESGELGIPNVTVNLFTGSGSLVSTTTTNTSGYYLFDNLLPGDYFVEFVPLTDYTISPQDAGGDAVDSDANTSTGRTAITTLIANEHDMTWDAGMYYEGPEIDCCDQGDKPQILIMEYTGEDCSATHTTQDEGKFGCTGDPDYDPNVYIISNDNDDPSSGNIWFSGNVALNGVYYIDAANAGATQLENNTVIHIFDQQGGTLLQTVFFHTSCSQPLSENGDQWGANKLLGIIFVNGIDCGSIPASIGDFVWYDINNNGIQETGEPGLPNVTVKLYTGAGALVSTTTTNASGYYLFDNLTPGDYFVEFTLLSGYTFSPKDQGTDDAKDSDANTSTGVTVTTTLTAGESDMTWDAGMYTPPAPASLGDFVWHDLNKNGIQDDGATGLPNVTVNLYTGTGVIVGTKTTNASGYYLFDNLTPGDYFVEFVLLSGYTFSPKDQGVDDTIDSDANTSSGRTIVTTLTIGENDLTWDAGMYEATPELASIGDFVWHDIDIDGIQDPGEVGLPDVTVKLYTGTGTLVGTTTTNARGYYLFDNLTPGSYYLDFTLLPGYTWSPYDQGLDEAIDSDANSPTSVTTLDPGENDMTWDAGMYIPSPDCTPPTSLCELPTSWDYNVEVTGTVEWNSLGIGNANDIKKKIRIYGDGTVIVPSGDLNLKDSEAVLFIEGPTLVVKDGKLKLETSGANYTQKGGALQTKDHFEQKENTIVCISDADVEIGEEEAGTDFRPGDSSQADWKNDGGYRYLENNCINVTHDFKLEDKGTGTGINGVDVFIDNCMEIGDEGANHATPTAFGTADGDDGGNWEAKSRQYIFGTTIVLAKGNFTIDKDILTVVDARIKVNKDGDFEVKGDGTLDCGPLCVAVEDEIKNNGTWLATGLTWYSKNKDTTNVPGAGPETDETTILSSCFDDCDCFPGEDCYEGSIGDYVWYDEDYNGEQDDNFPSDPSHGIEDVKLTLYDGAFTPLAVTYTNAAGWYLFTDLAAGDYFVEVDPSSLPSELTTDPRGGTGVFPTYDYDGIDTPNIAAVTLDYDCGGVIDDCCDFGKPQKITMRYTGEDCSATSHTQDPDKVNCTGDPAFEPDVYIISNDDSNPSAGNIWFSGPVTLNGNYVIDATLAGETQLGTNTYIHIFKQVGGSLVLLQTVNFHTSCSQPLSDGDQWGANKLMSILFVGGEVCIGGDKENLDVDFGYSDIPLPVTLSSFTVTSNGGNVEINWVTESEIENQGFVLERRIFESGDDWQEIANYLTNDDLQGQGSVTHSTSYEYMDQLVQLGLTYEYRLGDVDYDGIVEYHSTRTVTVDEDESSALPKQFTVKPAYPNPFNPSTTIEYAIPKDGRVSITIYDLTGQRVSELLNTEQMAGWHKIRWNGNSDNGIQMAAGIYLVTVNTGNSIKTMKLVFVK